MRARSVVIGMAVLALGPRLATARPRFEPTDLELEEPGVTEIDLQFGPVDGPKAPRIVAPDFELDLGITPRFELDLDGAFGPESKGSTRFFDHLERDNLWASVKLGLVDHHVADSELSWAMGLQVGPKLPVTAGAHGLGIESLLLIGLVRGPLHLVLNAGGLDDPAVHPTPRPYGVEGGLDLEYELVHDRWSILGELGGIWYGSPDANQLSGTAGIQFQPNPMLQLSIVALGGALAGSDKYGVLFGVSPKLKLW